MHVNSHKRSCPTLYHLYHLKSGGGGTAASLQRRVISAIPSHCTTTFFKRGEYIVYLLICSYAYTQTHMGAHTRKSKYRESSGTGGTPPPSYALKPL